MEKTIFSDEVGLYIAGSKWVTFAKKHKIGKISGFKVYLNSIEAKYLIEMHNFSSARKVKAEFLTYIAYRYLRFKNKKPSFQKPEKKNIPTVQLKTASINLPDRKFNAEKDKHFVYLPEGKELYDKFWFGQWGIYKANCGKGLYLDPYEAYFLWEKGLIDAAVEKPKWYDHYKFWRERGYIVKSGLKFGSTFRIYEPAARPGQHKHAKFLLRLDEVLNVSDLSRAVRVAHGVNKTFLFYANPGKVKKPAFYLSDGAVMLLHETDKIEAGLLTAFAKEQINKGLIPYLAVVDNDTSITLYRMSIYLLDGKKYYTIEWLRL